MGFEWKIMRTNENRWHLMFKHMTLRLFEQRDYHLFGKVDFVLA